MLQILKWWTVVCVCQFGLWKESNKGKMSARVISVENSFGMHVFWSCWKPSKVNVSKLVELKVFSSKWLLLFVCLMIKEQYHAATTTCIPHSITCIESDTSTVLQHSSTCNEYSNIMKWYHEPRTWFILGVFYR